MKKIFSIIICVIWILFLKIDTFAVYQIPIENVFSDITKDYPYYNELQTLYDKSMIFPDGDGKFNPYKLLTRDEFVGIASEVSCTKCIQPNARLDILDKYTTQPFYDVFKTNKYFYCIGYAKDKSFVNGYDTNFRCDDGTFKAGEKPFCTNNNIILEEALAVILRMSGILTNDQAEKIRQDIANGKITQPLSSDVLPKNPDGSVYSFYPDFKVALDYSVVEYDNKGNKKTYHLIAKADDKLRPKKSITKEEFLHIAYVALKANSCVDLKPNNLALQIKVLDKKCSQNDSNCTLSDLNDTASTYDFGTKVEGICDKGVSHETGYIWRFFNTNTGEEIKKYGLYVDNYTFLSPGVWKVFLRVVDNCGNTGEVYNTFSIGSQNALQVSLKADPIFGYAPLKVDFQSIATGGTLPYTYAWYFGDGNLGYSKDMSNVYKTPGVYEGTLVVIDKSGKTASATSLIEVLEQRCDLDADKDGIGNCTDICPLVAGSKYNAGCPILERRCGVNDTCSPGFSCVKQDLGVGVCLPIDLQTSCNYTSGNAIIGAAVCNSCPCKNNLDFDAAIKKCDKVFPAIASPDGTQLYSRGKFYEIK